MEQVVLYVRQVSDLATVNITLKTHKEHNKRKASHEMGPLTELFLLSDSQIGNYWQFSKY